MKNTTSSIRGEGGFALFTTFLGLMILMTLGAIGMMVSNLEARSSAHYKTGNQAFFTAEAGLTHAISVMNARGVQSFQNDIVDTTNWTRLYGAAYKTMADASGYQIAITADATSPNSRGTITSTGLSNMEAKRVLRVNLAKGANADTGALYMAADTVDPDFGARDQFLIDGNDYKMNLTANPTGPIRPGIATRNDAVTQAAKDELSNPQKLRVKGLDFSLSPLNPSVVTTQGPTTTDLEQMVSYILANNPVTTVSDQNIASGAYGTTSAPQITHLTNTTARLNGSMTGAGILIADGEFTINGSANFIGWMIVRGDTIVSSATDDTLVDGNATIAGSLWTGDLKVKVGGSAVIAYCMECMQLANNSGNGNNTPKVMTVVSWQEVL